MRSGVIGLEHQKPAVRSPQSAARADARAWIDQISASEKRRGESRLSSSLATVCGLRTGHCAQFYGGSRKQRALRRMGKGLRSAYSSGFTLIEVLAALIIVSLGMMAVIQAVSQTASNSSYLREKTIAHWVAMNRLTQARLEPGAPKVDKTSDEVEMAGREWRWTMTVTQTPVETMRRIDISVRPAEADEDSSMATITGFYGSAIAPPGSALIVWEGLEMGENPRGREEQDDQEGDKDEDEQEPPELEPPTDEEQPDMPEMPPDVIEPPDEDPSL